MKIKEYLAESVYYPCSGATMDTIDLSPVGKCTDISHKFVFVDVAMDENAVRLKLQHHGLEGYQWDPEALEPRQPEDVFGFTWDQLAQRHLYELSMLGQHWQANNAFILLTHLEGVPRGAGQPLAKPIQIMFIRFFAVAAYSELYVRNSITPACLVHKCPGMAFGGNYSSYAQHLLGALLANPEGLPDHILHDQSGQPVRDEYLPLVEYYEAIGPIPDNQLILRNLVNFPSPADIVYSPFNANLPEELASDGFLINSLLDLCENIPFAAPDRNTLELSIRRCEDLYPGDRMQPDKFLGLYVHSLQTIILFEKPIGDCAQALGVTRDQVRNVVLLREAGHWISHIWPIVGAPLWDAMSWCAVGPSMHEFLAQSIAYHALKLDAENLAAELNVCKQLEGRQPPGYQHVVKGLLWEESSKPCPNNWWFILLPHILKDVRPGFENCTRTGLVQYALDRELLDIPDEVAIVQLI
jgi:hypothetical protein